MNNAELAQDNTNDDTGDYFGMNSPTTMILAQAMLHPCNTMAIFPQQNGVLTRDLDLLKKWLTIMVMMP